MRDGERKRDRNIGREKETDLEGTVRRIILLSKGVELKVIIMDEELVPSQCKSCGGKKRIMHFDGI